MSEKKVLKEESFEEVIGGLVLSDEMSLTVQQDLEKILQQANPGTTNKEKMQDKIRLVEDYLNTNLALSEVDKDGIRRFIAQMTTLMNFI